MALAKGVEASVEREGEGEETRRGGECKRRERSRCLERGNPPGWPATLISVGSFALPKRSNRGEAAFNHSIADAPDPSSCLRGAEPIYPGYTAGSARRRRARAGCLLIILAIGRRGKQTVD